MSQRTHDADCRRALKESHFLGGQYFPLESRRSGAFAEAPNVAASLATSVNGLSRDRLQMNGRPTGYPASRFPVFLVPTRNATHGSTSARRRSKQVGARGPL